MEHRTLNQSGNLLAGSFAPSNPAHFYVPAPGIKTTCARVAFWNTTHFHQRVFTFWVLTVSASVYNYMFWPGMDPRWSHTCSLFPGAVTAQRSLHFPFPKQVSHEMVAWKPVLQRCVLACVPCPFLELRASFEASTRDSSRFESQKPLLNGRRATPNMFHLRARRNTSCTLLKSKCAVVSEIIFIKIWRIWTMF